MIVKIHIPMKDKNRFNLPWLEQTHDTVQFFKEYRMENSQDEELLKRLSNDLQFPPNVLTLDRYKLIKTYGKNPKVVVVKR